jgi:hypothetical protein
LTLNLIQKLQFGVRVLFAQNLAVTGCRARLQQGFGADGISRDMWKHKSLIFRLFSGLTAIFGTKRTNTPT